MKTKNKIKTESALFLIILLGIVILLNLLSVKFFARGDLTKDNLYTLSGASVGLLNKLDDKIIVKAYFTKNLPGRYASLERHVHDLLEEFQQRSGGKMQVEFIDPSEDEDEEKMALAQGIHKMPNPDIEKDQATVKEGYRGILFSYGENTEVIPAVESPVGLEYEITSVLKKISGQKTEIGFLTGHGEPEITPPPDQRQQMAFQDPKSRGAFRTIRTNLDIYDYKQINSKSIKKGIPKSIGALVVAGTNQKLSDTDLYNLDQYLLSGGSVALFVDGVSVSKQQAQFPGMPESYNTTVNEPNLRKFLEHYGVSLGRDLVMDAQAGTLPARCMPLPLPIPRPYPAWPLVTAFGEEHPITFRLGSLTLPYGSSVRVTKAAKDDPERKTMEIAFSSGNSWSVAGADAVVDPCSIEVSKSLESSIPLAAAIKGTFTSFFKGKPLPKAEGAENGSFDANKEGFIEKSTAPGRLVVVGSAGLPTDETISMLARINRRQALNNFTFVQNILDWMTNEEELIAVRMKNVDDPPLEKASEGVKGAVKYGHIIGLPLVFMLFGFVRWRIRRSQKGDK